MKDLPDPALGLTGQPEDISLAMLGWAEGRGEPADGLVAIVHVAVERAQIKGTTVKEQAFKHSRNGIYQFSCFNEKDPNRAKVLTPLKYGSLETWNKCLLAARNALQGLSSSPAKGATHYVVKGLWMRPTAAGKRPQWYELLEVASRRTQKVAVIGGHVFAKCPF